MLAKCANPSCPTRFHRFNQGKLFRLTTCASTEEYLYLFTVSVHVLMRILKKLLDKFHDFGYLKVRELETWRGRRTSIQRELSKN